LPEQSEKPSDAGSRLGRYDADLGALAEFGSRFVPLASDAETTEWLLAHGAPHGLVRSWFVELLAHVMSSYDAHGLTGSYPMHLLSMKQWRSLVGADLKAGARLLDVGAGAGYVTDYARPLFEHITCSETSKQLARRLRARGFEVIEADLATAEHTPRTEYDVISCLNVLDRTSYPRRLLGHLRSRCTQSTRLVVAMPLPVSAHVHVGGATISPVERLPADAPTWEASVVALSRELFLPSGLSIVRIARAPYFSRGDRHAALYVLDDAIWVLQPAPT
jgi:SAM-dependent methyltransferase